MGVTLRDVHPDEPGALEELLKLAAAAGVDGARDRAGRGVRAFLVCRIMVARKSQAG